MFNLVKEKSFFKGRYLTTIFYFISSNLVSTGEAFLEFPVSIKVFCRISILLLGTMLEENIDDDFWTSFLGESALLLGSVTWPSFGCSFWTSFLGESALLLGSVT